MKNTLKQERALYDKKQLSRNSENKISFYIERIIAECNNYVKVAEDYFKLSCACRRLTQEKNKIIKKALRSISGAKISLDCTAVDLLFVIEETNAMSIEQLKEIIGVKNLRFQTRKLIECGLIYISKDASDLRVTGVTISEKGAEIRNKLLKSIKKQIRGE